MSSSCVGWSRPSSLIGPISTSVPSSRRVRTTRSSASAMSSRCDCRASHTPRKQVDSDQRGCPYSHRTCRSSVPVPVARGEPGEGYPWSWSVVPWIAGEVVTDDRLADLDDAAAKLAEFVLALQAIDPTGGPTAGPPNSHRGIPLSWRDEPTRKALDQLHDMIDIEAAAAAWDARCTPRRGPAIRCGCTATFRR